MRQKENLLLNKELIKIGIYICLMILIIVLSFLNNKEIRMYNEKKVEGKKIYLILILFLFTIVMALRSQEVGVDTSAYGRIYNIINYGTLGDALKNAPLTAPVYVIGCRILGLFFKDPQWLSVISAIIINFCLYKYISKTSKDYMLSLFCWIGLTLFFFSMNGTRQTIAMVISMNSVNLLAENVKSKKGWLLLFTAIGIHTTTIFLIIAIALIIFMNKIKNKSTLFWSSVLGSISFSLIFNKGVTIFIDTFQKYSMYTNGESQYSIYSGTGNGRIIILYLFLLLFIILFFMKSLKSKDKKEDFNKKILPAIVFGTIFGIFNSRNEIIMRLVLFYTSFYISFIPDVISKYNSKEKFVLKLLTVLIIGTYGILSLKLNQNGVVPYTTFFR